MSRPSPEAHVVRFGVFELDVQSGELRKAGARLNLSEQPLQILTALLQRPDELVTRDELRQRLWPSDTFVDFEHGLNAAVKRLRDVLGDSADTPRFIETVPRRGYRFIAPVAPAGEKRGEDSSSRLSTDVMRSGAPAPAPVQPSEPRSRRRLWRLGLVTTALLPVAMWWTAQGDRPRNQTSTPQPTLTRLTANPGELAVSSATISPNGHHLAYADSTGIHVRVIDTGETRRLAGTRGLDVYAWSGDSTRVRAASCDRHTCTGWEISLLGGGARRLAGVTWRSHDAVKGTRDGSRLITVTEDRDLKVSFLDGEPPRVLARDVGAVSWALDGTRVFFVNREASAIQSVSVQGGRPVTVLAASGEQFMADGERITELIELQGRGFLVVTALHATATDAASPRYAIWALDTNPAGVSVGPPRRVIVQQDPIHRLSASADSQRVVFLSGRAQADVYIAKFEMQAGVTTAPRRLTLDDRSDEPYSWTPDGRSVLFTSDRNGTTDIFQQPLESDIAEPLVVGAGDQNIPRVTSDGRWVLYSDVTAPGRTRLMRIPLVGGTPKPILEVPGFGLFHCSTHGRCIVLEQQGSQRAIWSVDPARGQGAQLGGIPGNSPDGCLMPDGEAFAYIVPVVLDRRIAFALYRCKVLLQ